MSLPFARIDWKRRRKEKKRKKKERKKERKKAKRYALNLEKLIIPIVNFTRVGVAYQSSRGARVRRK